MAWTVDLDHDWRFQVRREPQPVRYPSTCSPSGSIVTTVMVRVIAAIRGIANVPSAPDTVADVLVRLGMPDVAERLDLQAIALAFVRRRGRPNSRM
jgi:hypothetical protein